MKSCQLVYCLWQALFLWLRACFDNQFTDEICLCVCVCVCVYICVCVCVCECLCVCVSANPNIAYIVFMYILYMLSLSSRSLLAFCLLSKSVVKPPVLCGRDDSPLVTYHGRGLLLLVGLKEVLVQLHPILWTQNNSQISATHQNCMLTGVWGQGGWVQGEGKGAGRLGALT